MYVLLWLILLILLIVYIRKTNALAKQVEQLGAEIRRLRGDATLSAPKVVTVQQSAGQAEETAPLKPAAPPARPSRTKTEWEALIGGKLLNRIGALALVFGVGFFLKYAFDKNLISEPLRVFIGYLIGGGLNLAGARWHQKGFTIFAQGLIGAGIAVLYLTVYASFNFYQLVPQAFAFVLMSIVTAGAFFGALRYDALAIACLGWAGGFLTPILLSTGQANEVGLFTYIVLLDIGLLAIALKKEAWVILEPLALAGTYFIYLLWYDQHYRPENLLLTVLFLSLFWGLFYGLDVWRTIQATKTFLQIRQAVAVFNALFYYAAMYALVETRHHQWMGLVTLAIGAIYFLTFLIFKRRQLGEAMTHARLNLTAITLLVIATAVQLSDFPTVIFWSLEALLLIWCGIHWKQRYVWQAASALMALAVLKLWTTAGALGFSPIENFTLIFNLRALTFATLAATLGVSAWLLKRADDKNRDLIRSGFHSGVFVLLFILVTVENTDYFRQAIFFARQDYAAEVSETIARLRNLQQLALSGLWLLYSVLLMVAGIWRRKQGLRIMAMVLFGVTILKIFIYDLSFLETLYRIFSFIGLGLILLAVSYLYQRFKAVIFDSNK
ncbi:MAG: DUF2339 domain-containing protein [candidate division KSB1 bacterium]|nr:DUF2339 domain-containing protein [candidate division KSB1 bacterium]